MDGGGAFRSRMSRGETAAALGWLPVHILVLPMLLLLLSPGISGADLNFWVYAIGALVLVPCCFRFLRRDFDRVCEQPGKILLQLALGWFLLVVSSRIVDYVLVLLQDLVPPEDNPNQAALEDLALQERGKIVAMSIFLAPLAEEALFRGVVFGTLRKRSRAAAYLVSIVLFAVHSTWQIAVANPEVSPLFLAALTLPNGVAAAFCYERTNNIWVPALYRALVSLVPTVLASL